jgi:hypothetical protein
MMAILALVLGGIVLLELIALVGRRMWAHWKLGRRRPMIDEAVVTLAEAIVADSVPQRPEGRLRRRAFRLAALEVFGVLAGGSRARLTRVVGELGLVEDVIRTLRRSPRAFARRTAADELAEIRSPLSAGALAAGLDDRDPIVRVACVRGLASLGELGRIERILSVLDRDSGATPASAASAMLALAGAAPESLAPLQGSARSPLARRLAALALAQAGEERAMPSLLGELAAENMLLSSVAVQAIERVGGAQAIASLEHVVADGDRDPALREQAMRALERVRPVGGAP